MDSKVRNMMRHRSWPLASTRLQFLNVSSTRTTQFVAGRYRRFHDVTGRRKASSVFLALATGPRRFRQQPLPEMTPPKAGRNRSSSLQCVKCAGREHEAYLDKCCSKVALVVKLMIRSARETSTPQPTLWQCGSHIKPLCRSLRGFMQSSTYSPRNACIVDMSA